MAAEAGYSQNISTGDKASHITEEIISESQVVDGKNITVEQTIWKVPESDSYSNKTVKLFVVKDEEGAVHYSKNYPIEVHEGEKGFRGKFEVNLGKVSTSEREALILNYGSYPSAPGSGIQKQFFVWRGDELKPLSPPIEIYGQFGSLTSTPVNGAPKLENDEIILNTKLIAYYFHLIMPVKIDLGNDAASVPYELLINEDPVSGLDIIPVEVLPKERRRSIMKEKPQQIKLYDSPVGNESTVTSVSKESSIDMGPAYGKASIGKHSYGYSEPTISITHQVQRLKVIIDGNTGFVEKDDFTKLGLPVFG